MRSSKPKSIRDLTNLKRLKPIGKLLNIEEWQNEETVSVIDILSMNSHILYDASMMLHGHKPYNGLLIDTYMNTVKILFERIDQGYMLKSEYKEIKKKYNIKFDD